MSTHLVTLIGIVALSGLALGAQAPASSPRSAMPSAQTQPTPSPSLGAIRLSGCIKPWDVSTMGRAPSEGAAPGDPGAVVRDYVLTNAEPVVDPEKKLTPDAQAHSTYLLRSSTSVDLARHADQKVEVAGTVEKAQTHTADPERGDSVLKSAMPVVLQVVTVEMIATSCP